MRPANGDGEKGTWDLGGWMETTAVFPGADERRLIRIDATVDVESTLDSFLVFSLSFLATSAKINK
jgi:hypothetical protein